MQQLKLQLHIEAHRENRICKICNQPLTYTKFELDSLPKKRFHFVNMGVLVTAECKYCNIDYVQVGDRWLSTHYSKKDLNAIIPLELTYDILRVHEETLNIDYDDLDNFLLQHQPGDLLYICDLLPFSIGLIFVRGEHLLNAIEFVQLRNSNQNTPK